MKKHTYYFLVLINLFLVFAEVQASPNLCFHINSRQKIVTTVAKDPVYASIHQLRSSISETSITYIDIKSGTRPSHLSIATNGLVKWAPDTVGEWEIIYRVSCAGREYEAPIKFVSKASPNDPFGEIFNLRKECDETIKAWRTMQCPQCNNANVDESDNPNLSSVPTDLYAHIMKMEHMMRMDLDGNSTYDDKIYGSKLVDYFRFRLSESQANIILKEELQNAIKATALFSDNSWFRKQYENTAPSDLVPGVFSENLFTKILQITLNSKNVSGSIYAPIIYTTIKYFLENNKTAPGMSEEDLYFVYMLKKEFGLTDALFALRTSNDETDISDINSWKDDIEQKVNQLLIQKTTPALVCNNARAQLTKTRVSWKDLGMETYQSYLSFAPWVESFIVQGVGKSMYENPEVWEVAKIVPVFGTALAIIDSTLTLYEGKNAQGVEVDRRLSGAFFAIDLAATAFEFIGLAKSITKYTSYALELRKIAKGAKSDRIAVNTLNDVSVILRNELRYTSGLEGIPFCSTAGARLALFDSTARARLGLFESKIERLYASEDSEYAGKVTPRDVLGAGGCMISSVVDKNTGKIVEDYLPVKRFIVDTNVSVGYAAFAKAKAGLTSNDPVTYWGKVIENLRTKGESDPKSIILKSLALEESYAGKKAMIGFANLFEIADGRKGKDAITNFGHFNKQFKTIGFEVRSSLQVEDYVLGKKILKDTPILTALKKAKLGEDIAGKSGAVDQATAAASLIAPRADHSIISNMRDIHTLVSADGNMLLTLLDLAEGAEPISYRKLTTTQKAKEVFNRIIKVNAKRRIDNSNPLFINITKDKLDSSIGTYLTVSEKNIDISNLGIMIDALPGQCWHFQDTEVRKAFPKAALVSDIINNIN
jgi:hypothetical protein